jgi:hypothetical protein
LNCKMIELSWTARWISSLYRAVNTLHLGRKCNKLMLYREINVFCSDIPIEHK